jgi:Ca-activated chloride channel homolog
MQQEMVDFGEDADIKQAIVDLSIEYGLVTDYTSMVVVREEVFDTLGIKRQNQQRVQVETQAQQNRASRPVSINRADKSDPMFKSSRPSYKGSGSFEAGALLLVLMLLIIKLGREVIKERTQ